MELTIDELNILIEAMKDWPETVQEEASPEVLKALLSVMMRGGEMDDRAREILAEGASDWIGKKGKREETSILIRAKLIQMRDKLVVQEAVHDCMRDS